MPLYDNPPFVATIYKPASGFDAGGGVQITYSVRTADVRGILNKASASEVELFAQMGMKASSTFVTADTSAQRGDKLVYSGRSFHITGIVLNEAMGNIPTLNKLVLDEQL